MNSAFVPDTVRDRLQPVYDTYELAKNTATPTQIIFFGNPVSASKGINKTNLSEPYRMSNGINLRVMALRFVTIGMAKLDIEALFKNYAARLIIGQKNFLEAPLEYFPGGGGISGSAAVSTTATTSTLYEFAYNNGAPDPKAVFGLGNGLQIPFGTTFRVELNGTTFTTDNTNGLGAGIFLRCYLDTLWTEIPQ